MKHLQRSKLELYFSAAIHTTHALLFLSPRVVAPALKPEEEEVLAAGDLDCMILLVLFLQYQIPQKRSNSNTTEYSVQELVTNYNVVPCG